MSQPTLNMWIVVLLAFITLSIIVFVAGMLIVAFKFKNIVQQALKDAKPAMNQASDTMRSVSDVARTVQGRVDHIMHIAEDTADNVSKKVKTTSSVITETISSPLISVSGVITGVSKGLEVWNMLKKHGGNGHATDRQ